MRPDGSAESVPVVGRLQIVDHDTLADGGVHEPVVAEIESDMCVAGASVVGLEENEISHPQIRPADLHAGLELVGYHSTHVHTEHFVEEFSCEGGAVDPGFAIPSEPVSYAIPFIYEFQ